MQNEIENVGLQCLDDDTLAKIVENDINEYGELKTWGAKCAFEELSRRTPGSY